MSMLNQPLQRSVISTLVACCLTLFLTMYVSAQSPRYRTFSQEELSQKKSKAGKLIATRASFSFSNFTTRTLTGIHIRFNRKVLTIEDSSALSNIKFQANGKLMTASCTIPPDSTVTFKAVFADKKAMTKVNYWWWTMNSTKIIPQELQKSSSNSANVYIQPTGGNVRDVLYKNVLTRPAGLSIGMHSTMPGEGWMKFLKSDAKYFPHTGPARCFDLIANSSGGRPFNGELKNPQVKKHNNHLLGEVHALKLAVVANDIGMTEPITDASALGDLVYHDSTNALNVCNNLTIRQILHLADSALTFCGDFDVTAYKNLDATIGSINSAFSGPYSAATFSPLVIEGTHGLDEVVFLHANTSTALNNIRRNNELVAVPEQYALLQNFPNPFNPVTTIGFILPEASFVTLKVYNVLGQEIATLIQNEEYSDGSQSIEFDGTNLTSGMYLYRLIAQPIEGDNHQPFQETKRFMLMK